jgi:hypothetical protein
MWQSAKSSFLEPFPFNPQLHDKKLLLEPVIQRATPTK